MKALHYIFLSLCALAEAGLLVFGISGVVMYGGNANPDVPAGVVYAVTVCALILLGITVRSFIRVAKGKENPILFGFLFKIPVLIFSLGIIWFALGIPEAGWLAVILSIPLGVLIIFLPKLKGNVKKQPTRQGGLTEKLFTREKAEWSWDDAAAEYLRLQGGATGREFSDEENGKIYNFAGTPLAYFLGWLIKNDYVSDEFRSAYDADSIQSVREERMTPVEFLGGCMDYVLVREEISPEVLRFVDLYFAGWPIRAPFNHRTKRYFFDYYKVVCSTYDVPRYYCVDFDWDSFRRLSEVLDLRFREFRQNCLEEDSMEDLGERLRSQYFDTEAALCAEPGTSPAYVEKCAAAFMNMSAGLRREIAESLIEYCVDELPEEPSAEWVIRHFSPEKVAVFKPETAVPASVSAGISAGISADVPAYVVLGESEWEPEHGISFTVIGDHVVAFGYYADAELPRAEDSLWRYRILEDAARGNYCAADVIPARFGGRSGTADNQVIVPRAAAELKEQYEDLIEALYVLKKAERFDCKITYQDSKPNFLFLEAAAGERRTFADSIALG